MDTTHTASATVRYASTVEGMFGYSAFEVVRDAEFVTRFVFPTDGAASLHDRAETFANRTAAALNAR